MTKTKNQNPKSEVPVKSFVNIARYPGGKHKKAKYLLSLFPKKVIEYRDVMVGGGSVYLCARANNVAQSYWINDKFKHLYCFWKMAQTRCVRLHQVLMDVHEECNKDPKTLREMFEEARSTKKLNEFEAACYWFFLNRVTFSGTILSGGFSLNAAQERFTRSSVDRILSLDAALKDTLITNLDFSKVIEDDRTEAFLFIDPPYLGGNSNLYGNKGKLHKFDHIGLARQLKETNHDFLLTYRDVPEIRSLYKWANVQELDYTYSMSGKRGGAKKIVRELIVRNY